MVGTTDMARPPTVISAKGVPSSREIHPYVRIQPPTHLDDDTKRFLTQMQDAVAAATLPARSDTTMQGVIVQSVNFTGTAKAPVLVTVRHNLGQAFAGYRCTRAYAGSAPFAAVEVANNGGKDVNVYLVLSSTAVGVFDIEVFSG